MRAVFSRISPLEEIQPSQLTSKPFLAQMATLLELKELTPPPILLMPAAQQVAPTQP
jgi:hypothetical protein